MKNENSILIDIVREAEKDNYNSTEEEIMGITKKWYHSLNNKDIQNRIEDILKDENQTPELSLIQSKYPQLKVNQLSWLLYWPIYNLNPSVLELIYDKIIKAKNLEKKEACIRRLIFLIQKKGKGLSISFIKGKIKSDPISKLVEIELYLLLLQLDYKHITPFIEKNIFPKKQPHLIIILIATYKKKDPVLAFKHFETLCNSKYIPEDIEWNICKSNLKTTLYYFFQIEESLAIDTLTPLIKDKAPDWARDLLQDILQFSLFKEQRKKLMGIQDMKTNHQTKQEKPSLKSIKANQILSKILSTPEKGEEIARLLVPQKAIFSEFCTQFKNKFLAPETIETTIIEKHLIPFEHFLFSLPLISSISAFEFYQITGFKIDLSNRILFNGEKQVSFSASSALDIEQMNRKILQQLGQERQEKLNQLISVQVENQKN